MRATVARCAVRATLAIAATGKKRYEPVEVGGRRFKNLRDSEHRWKVMAETLREYNVRNVLDIGCAEGWFVRRAATELNCFAIGIEASDRVLIGELARLHDEVERMAIMRTRLSARDIHDLPKFDAVICMSVVHHIIRSDGVAVAEEFVRALAQRAEKLLIFEMGTADEKSWTAMLPELPQGQETFVVGFLERCGFRNVRVIAESLAYHREVKRLLFAAEPVTLAEPAIGPLASAPA